MTQLMKLAIERLQALPEFQQDQFAQFLLHELADDERWVASTSKHVDTLGVFTQRILDDDTAIPRDT